MDRVLDQIFTGDAANIKRRDMSSTSRLGRATLKSSLSVARSGLSWIRSPEKLGPLWMDGSDKLEAYTQDTITE
jgi:hypothetical protein